MALKVRTADDWATLAAAGVSVVIDPMVARSGELFLRGPHGASDPAASWNFLSRNVHAVGAFFDALVLHPSVPIFNYGDTFDAGLNLDQRVFAPINDRHDVLLEVDVEYESYQRVKSAALDELRALYKGPRRIDSQLARDVLEELSAADYQWQPHLGVLEQELESEDEKRLARYFLGGLIFSGYAQLLGGDHVMQPKRSRLFLAASLSARRASFGAEEEIFGALKARARASVTDLPWRPTFLAHLLETCATPREVVSRVLELRKAPEVCEYREWLSEALENWQAHGRLESARRDVRAIAAAVDRAIGATGVAPTVEVKVTVADVVAGKPPGSVNLTPTLSALWGWMLSSLPGKRYRKLLTRAVAADHAYAKIENRLQTVWRAAP